MNLAADNRNSKLKQVVLSGSALTESWKGRTDNHSIERRRELRVVIQTCILDINSNATFATYSYWASFLPYVWASC